MKSSITNKHYEEFIEFKPAKIEDKTVGSRSPSQVSAEEQKEGKKEGVRVVCEYPEVFPADLPGLPPNK